jgi:hypothetical protein
MNLNPIDLWYKFLDFYDKNWEYGGFHKVAILAINGLVLYFLVTIWMFRDNKKGGEK